MPDRSASRAPNADRRLTAFVVSCMSGRLASAFDTGVLWFLSRAMRPYGNIVPSDGELSENVPL